MKDARAKALAYLERIQKGTYESLRLQRPWLLPDYETRFDDLVRKIYDTRVAAGNDEVSFEAFQRQARLEALGSPDLIPSAWQHPSSYLLMSRMVKEIEDALDRWGVKPELLPVFGSLPTGRVNGVTLAVPGTRAAIVLLEDGLFGFANLAAKAIVRVFPLESDDGERVRFSMATTDWQQQLASTPEIVERFSDVLFAYILGGHPHKARPYLPDPGYDEPSTLLRESMELFVMGHEYAHFLCGHVHAPSVGRTKLGDLDVEEIRTNFRRELEADVRGLDIMLDVMGARGVDLSLSLWGADFFFECIDFIQRAVRLVATGKASVPASTTHPPPALRRKFLHDVLRHNLSDEHVAGAFEVCGTLHAIFEALWVICEPALALAHREGLRPASTWKATSNV